MRASPSSLLRAFPGRKAWSYIWSTRLHYVCNARGVMRLEKDTSKVCTTDADGPTECVTCRFKFTPAGTIEVAGIAWPQYKLPI